MAHQRLYGEQEQTRCNFMLLKEHYDELQRLAEMDGKSVSAVLRELIAKFLKDDRVQDANRS